MNSLRARMMGMDHGSWSWYDGQYIPSAAEKTEFQATRAPWAENVRYGYYGLALLCGTLAFYTALHGLRKVSVIGRRSSFESPADFLYNRRLTSIARLLSYPRLPNRRPFTWIGAIYTVGPLGPNILLFVFFVFASLWCFVNKYYYRPPFYGMPPVAARSEWLAMCSLPFIFVLGAKRNIISAMTGVSHDKLQVYHQGLAFTFLFMSLVHTIAEVIRASRQYPWSYTWATNHWYVTGFACFVPLVVLCFGSFPVIRHRFYESFYLLHIISSLVFLGLLYWHVIGMLDGNAYMNATLVLFFVGITTRGVMYIYNNRGGHQAKLDAMDDSVVRVRIPTNMSWVAGQHVFLKFRTIRILESHPFTIASVPSQDRERKHDGKRNEMVVLLKPAAGFTRRLLEAATNSEKGSSLSVWIDGPYGHDDPTLRAYDSVLLLAGGTGFAHSIALLKDLVQNMKKGPSVDGCRCREIEVVWTVRHRDALSWVADELLEVLRDAPLESVKITVFVTGGLGAESLAYDCENTSVGSPSASTNELVKEVAVAVRNGRPNLYTIIDSSVTKTDGTLGVAACGPVSFATDVGNAVAKAQIKIMKDQTQCSEVYLLSEAFNW